MNPKYKCVQHTIANDQIFTLKGCVGFFCSIFKVLQHTQYCAKCIGCPGVLEYASKGHNTSNITATARWCSSQLRLITLQFRC